MNVYTKFNNKNLNTNFDFLNGLVMGNYTESETDPYYNKDVKGIQRGSSGNGNDIGNNGEHKITNPIKEDVYDELFKQATIHTGVKSTNEGGTDKGKMMGTNQNTKKRTKPKKQHTGTNTNTKKNKKKI